MLERLRNLWNYLTTRSGRTIAELEEENRLLRDQLGQRVLDETFVTGMFLGNGGFNMGFQGGAAQLLAEAFAKQIEDSGAANYLEVRFTSRHCAPGQSYVVTIQKCPGQTPHQLREAAERELAHLRARLGEV